MSLAGSGTRCSGAFSWTVGLASKFLLTTIAALVKMLIPRSWVHQGLQIMQWIVAVPDYAGKVTSPSGGTAYGFAGVNALRDVFMWLGIAIAPLTLVYATSRAMIGEGDPVAIPLLRLLAVGVVIVSYPYWWAQATALTDQITNAILTVPAVSRGLYKLMDYAVGGVALGGWQLVDLALMGAIALELLGLIFLKVVLIVLGALLYATGPVTIGLVPTQAGSALARAWTSAMVTLLGVGVAWAALFAVGALLIDDAATAGPLVAGNSAFGSIAGGLLLAVAGLASLWLCLKAAKEAGSLLRMQLSGLLVLAGRHSSSASSSTGAASRARTSGPSLRDYGSRLASAAGAANAELAAAGAGGAALAGTARAAGHVARRGLIGTAASSVRAGTGAMAGPAGAALGHTRAGAVASRMARAGTASWIATTPHQHTSRQGQSGASSGATDRGNQRRNGRQGPPPAAQPSDTKPRGPASQPRSDTGGHQSKEPIGGGGDRSPTSRPTHRARPAAPRPAQQPPDRTAGDGQRPAPSTQAKPSSPARRSSPPPPPHSPSPRKPAAGEGTPDHTPEQAGSKRQGRRWRQSPKRDGR